MVGAVIGNQLKHSNLSRLTGAALGASIGGLIGADIDRRRCELSKIAKANGLDMLVEKIAAPTPSSPPNTLPASANRNQVSPVASAQNDQGLRVAIVDRGRQFQTGSAKPFPEAEISFRQIADTYSYPQQLRHLSPNASREERAQVELLRNTRILLIGHTDDSGSTQVNADLSERRAQAVAKIFQERGISIDQLYFQGAGETLPIADNREEAGRARNRRVEIVDLNDENVFNAYLASRKPNVAYYRPVTTPAEPVPLLIPTPDNKKQQVDKTMPDSALLPSANAKTGKAPADHAPATSGSRSTSTTQEKPVRRTDASVASNKLPASGGNAPSQPSAAVIDFGGEPLGKTPAAVDIGKLSTNNSFGIISKAYADESLVSSCTQDRPRASHGVKSLRDGKEYATGEYMPGVYNSSWVALVNGHLVALNNVAVLRDGGSPAHKPDLHVYRDYKGDTKAKPMHVGSPEINTYQGDKALLYRVFDSGPIRCMDIVIPNANPREAPGSSLFYADSRHSLYSATFTPKLAK